MPRTSKLTTDQWRRLHERLLAGESARALAREAGIDEAAVRRHFGTQGALSAQSAQVRAAAQALAAGQQALEALPLAHRPAAISLAEQLRNVSGSLASAAANGAATAHRLTALANAGAQRIDDAAPLADPEPLRAVAALTAAANSAATIPLGLLAANRNGRLPGAGDRPPQSRGWSAEELERFDRQVLGLSPQPAAQRAGAKSGVLVVPGTMDEAAWEAMVAKARDEW